MSGLMEAATAVMRAAQTRLDVVARNIANVSAPGYKRQSAYATLAATAAARADLPAMATHVDATQGKLEATRNPLDLAISGEGFFAVKVGEQIRYLRQGHFSLRDDGTVVNSQGYALQQAGGGDLVLDRSDVRIEADGTIFDGGRPVAKLALQTSDAPTSRDGVLFDLPQDAREPEGSAIRQGMVEASNVSTGDEMIAMMGAIREAESGARLAQTYDDLLGRAISNFGLGGR